MTASRFNHSPIYQCDVTSHSHQGFRLHWSKKTWPNVSSLKINLIACGSAIYFSKEALTTRYGGNIRARHINFSPICRRIGVLGEDGLKGKSNFSKDLWYTVASRDNDDVIWLLDKTVFLQLLLLLPILPSSEDVLVVFVKRKGIV